MSQQYTISPVREDAEADELYLAVGKALSRWNVVENALCNIFVHAVVPSPFEIVGSSMSAYWAVISMEARLKMTNAAVCARIVYHPQLSVDWKTLKNKIGRKIKKRNEIAHGTVSRIWYWDRKAKIHKSEIFLCPSFFAGRIEDNTLEKMMSGDPRPDNRLTLKQVDDQRMAFTRLFHLIDDFHESYYEQIVQPEEDQK